MRQVVLGAAAVAGFFGCRAGDDAEAQGTGSGTEAAATSNDAEASSAGSATVTGTVGTAGPGSMSDGPTTDAGSSDTVGVDPMSAADWLHIAVTCSEDASMEILIEGIIETDIEGCAPPPDVEIDNGLLIAVTNWDGLPRSFDVGTDEDAYAALGDEMLVGTMILEVSAPSHPSVLTVDLAGETTTLEGVLDLQMCALINEAPCPSPGETQ